MDPLSAISLAWALVNIVRVSADAVTLVRRVSVKIENAKIDQVYYRLLGEEQRLKQWVKRNHLDGPDSLDNIHPDDRKTVLEMFKKMQTYLDQAARKFDRVEPYLKSNKRTLKGFAVKYRFLQVGYGDMKDILNTLSTMNSTLQLIASPLPQYQSPGRNAAERREAPQVTAATSQRSEEQGVPLADLHQTVSENSQSSNLEARRNLQVKVVYIKCMEAFKHVSMWSYDDHFNTAYSKLSVWGINLFDGPLALDEMLKAERFKLKDLRKSILRAFTNILVDLGGYS